MGWVLGNRRAANPALRIDLDEYGFFHSMTRRRAVRQNRPQAWIHEALA